MRYIRAFCLILALLATSTIRAEILWGKRQPLGNGMVCAFIEFGPQKNIQTIGVALDDGALENLPAGRNDLLLEFPVPAPPFYHVFFNWRPEGHQPGPYVTPHLDVHFYMIPYQFQKMIFCRGIDGAACATFPPDKYLPPNYFAGAPFAQFGIHWFDGSAPEFHGAPFTMAMVYGSYNGRIIYIEPMVDLKTAKEKTTITKAVPQPERFFQNTMFPRIYVTSYDKENKLHLIYLTEFTQKAASPNP